MPASDPTPRSLTAAASEAHHAVASGLLPGGGAASAVVGASIVLGLFTGVVALEKHRNVWVGMVLGFLVSLVVLGVAHAIAVA